MKSKITFIVLSIAFALVIMTAIRAENPASTPAKSTVVGSVYSPDGQPIVKAHLWAFRLNGEPLGDVETNQDGSFTFEFDNPIKEPFNIFFSSESKGSSTIEGLAGGKSHVIHKVIGGTSVYAMLDELNSIEKVVLLKKISTNPKFNEFADNVIRRSRSRMNTFREDINKKQYLRPELDILEAHLNRVDKEFQR